MPLLLTVANSTLIAIAAVCIILVCLLWIFGIRR
jgi:hypothetical protein